jgi:dihydrofolate reductase
VPVTIMKVEKEKNRSANTMKVTLLMAITLDGKIGKTPDHFPDWTGPEDKKLFVSITRRAGAVIMGSKTFDTIGTPLSGRKNIVLTRDKQRISQWENLWYTDLSPQAVLETLEKEGYREAVLAGGALVNSLFAEAGLIDDIIVTISPTIFGYGLSLFTPEISMELQLKDVRRLGRDLVCLTYSVKK